MKPTLTIFTPVYNRAYIIKNLYESLLKQTCKNFEWLIVDDGSTDNMYELVKLWIKEDIINIRYIRQKNGGKHRAINRGVNEAEGTLFFIVDSDDYLTDDAVEWIITTAKDIDDDDHFAGLAGIRIHKDGTKIGGGHDFGCIDANAIDIRLRHRVVGDLSEVFKTEILKKYPFPEFEGEQFCTEAIIWNRIADKYMLRYCHKGIYICEYLGDGLTAKMTNLRHKAPLASMLYYSELFHLNIPLIQKAKAAINFWRFQNVPYRRMYGMLSPLALAGFIPGKIMCLTDRHRNK